MLPPGTRAPNPRINTRSRMPAQRTGCLVAPSGSVGCCRSWRTRLAVRMAVQPHGLGSVATVGSRKPTAWSDLHRQASRHPQQLTAVHPRPPRSGTQAGHGGRPTHDEIKLPGPPTCPHGALTAETPVGIFHHSPTARRPLADQMRTAANSRLLGAAWHRSCPPSPTPSGKQRGPLWLSGWRLPAPAQLVYP